MKNRFEVVLMDLYDVGRSIDVAAAARLIPAAPELQADRSRDSPESLSLPQPYVVRLDRHEFQADHPLVSLSLDARLYEDGVVSMICRVVLRSALEDLHRIRSTRYRLDELGELTLRGLIQRRFDELFRKIRSVTRFEQYSLDSIEHETYATFCLLDNVGSPNEFLQLNARYLASFLLGERPEIALHKNLIDTTLRGALSFRESDVLVLDLDRCFIIDPDRDYEDILRVIELANYQLLELRVLDKLLDHWLDQAEDDIRLVYLQRSRRTRRLSRKLGNLLPLRLDALFILENLENTSKIIGDYYLGQVYSHLCGIINTKEWELSVRRRLETLQTIYSMAKVDVNERLLLSMEVLVVVFFALEIIALVIPFIVHH